MLCLPAATGCESLDAVSNLAFRSSSTLLSTVELSEESAGMWLSGLLKYFGNWRSRSLWSSLLTVWYRLERLRVNLESDLDALDRTKTLLFF